MKRLLRYLKESNEYLSYLRVIEPLLKLVCLFVPTLDFSG